MAYALTADRQSAKSPEDGSTANGDAMAKSEDATADLQSARSPGDCNMANGDTRAESEDATTPSCEVTFL